MEYWDTEENKPIILLLSAFAPEAKYSWFKQIRTLKKNYRVVMPNLLYFGKSRMNTPAFDVSDQVSAMNSLLEFLGAKKISLLGASYGGLIAIELAQSEKFEIEKLILASPKVIYSQDKDIYIQPGTKEPLLRTDLLVPGNAADLKRLFDLSYHKKMPIPHFVFKNLHKHLYTSNPHEKKQIVEACKAEKTSCKRKLNFNFSTLIICGKHDKLVSKEDVENLKELIGEQAQIILIPRTAHMPNYERPWYYNKSIKKFLAG
ncbi:MAG: alpha/beta hydrolase [Crocinitomicaceae bacterium]|nr:alpha/beta hydrolase [Crocinitomicaceae bacterium]